MNPKLHKARYEKMILFLISKRFIDTYCCGIFIYVVEMCLCQGAFCWCGGELSIQWLGLLDGERGRRNLVTQETPGDAEQVRVQGERQKSIW